LSDVWRILTPGIQPSCIAWRVIEKEVVPTCRELGISQIVWSPVAQGVLTGKYLPGQPAPRPLAWLKVWVGEDGDLMVDRSITVPAKQFLRA